MCGGCRATYSPQAGGILASILEGRLGTLYGAQEGAGALPLGLRLPQDLDSGPHRLAPAEGHGAAHDFPLAGLVAVAVADVELHRKDREGPLVVAFRLRPGGSALTHRASCG